MFGDLCQATILLLRSHLYQPRGEKPVFPTVRETAKTPGRDGKVICSPSGAS